MSVNKQVFALNYNTPQRDFFSLMAYNNSEFIQNSVSDSILVICQ